MTDPAQLTTPKQPPIVVPPGDYFNQCKVMVSALRSQGLVRSEINQSLPPQCQLGQGQWRALVYGQIRFPKKPRPNSPLTSFPWHDLATNLNVLCNNGQSVGMAQTTVPQESPGTQMVQGEKTYNPVVLPTFSRNVDTLWATKGRAIAKCFELPAKPVTSTTPTYPAGLAGRVRRRVFLARERVRQAMWYPRAGLKLAWDFPMFCVVTPIAVLTGLLSTLKLMAIAPFQALHLTQPKVEGRELVQAIIYTNDGHEFGWLRASDLDTHVRRRKRFGLETAVFSHVILASLERTLDGRIIAFDPNPVPTDATPDNHYMELEAPQESMAFLRKSSKTPWLKAFQWGMVVLALGIVVGGFVLVILTMLDPNAIPDPVLNAEGIIAPPTVLPQR